MTIEELHEDVRQFVKEIEARRREVPDVKKEAVQIETRTLVGKQAETYDRSLTRTINVVNDNSNNVTSNAP